MAVDPFVGVGEGEGVLVGTVTFGKEKQQKKGGGKKRNGKSERSNLPLEPEGVGEDDPVPVGVAEEPPAEPEGWVPPWAPPLPTKAAIGGPGKM